MQKNMITHRLFAILLLAALSPLFAQGKTDAPLDSSGGASLVAADTAADATPVRMRSYTLPTLEKQTGMRLLPTQEAEPIIFGRRADETVVKAVLKVRYLYSSSLIPLQSQIRIRLNGEVIGVLPITRENAGRETTRELALDPKVIASFNKLKFEFIAHYTDECEDPLHLSLWADLLRGTEVQLSTRQVPLPDDLAMLPQPFFDPQDVRRLDTTYVFAAQPSFATLQAAGITASWLGKLASWRRARFSVRFDSLPKAYAIVFATNAERPSFLRDLPVFAGPALSVMTNPADGYSKLLLVSGRDGADLQAAASTLALGSAALSGSRMEIVQWHEQALRKAYDAPNWVRLDRPMRLGELIESPQQLQVYGHVPETIRIDMRIPPDLFTWRSRGVPVTLRFRYTPPIRTSDSYLAMSVNGERVQIVNLRSSGLGGDSTHVTLPLLDNSLLGEGRELLIPAFKLGARNQIQYDFNFSYLTAGACKDTQIENIQAMIDPNSTIDFSGYPHYAEMPHLGYFATAGFPFTKYADLRQTAVVLPQKPLPEEIEVMLTLLGRMGESTGYPTIHVAVVNPSETGMLKDRDLLVIGTPDRQKLLTNWQNRLPAVISGPRQGIRPPAGTLDRLYDFFGVEGKMLRGSAPQKHVRGNGPLAAMLGFESPLSPGRSVVAVTAAAAEDFGQLLNILDDDNATKLMHGSVVLAYGGKAESIVAGSTYTLGSLPIWTTVWFPLSEHPILLAFMSAIAVLIFAFALWRTLRAVAQRRLQEADNRPE